MKIKTLKFSILLMAIMAIVVSCNDDDDDGTYVFVEEDRTEQQAKDNDSLVAYLSSHYYNSGSFQTGSNHQYTDIIIEELQEGETVPENHTLLIDAVQTRYTTYQEADYQYYVLNLNQGGGDSPNFTDKIRVRYEGISINTEEVFDSSVTPVDFNLQTDGVISGVIKAWQLVFPTFNTAMDFSISENGDVSYENYGLGVMFMPSGLGYFSATSTGSSYDNLIFKFELLQYEIADHDYDGIPSYLEDEDEDLDVVDDDSDEDGSPNFIDIDDDGDDVLTIDELLPNTYTVDTTISEEEPVLAADEFEISRTESNGVITIKTVTIVDSNNDGTPDYLDPDISVNYNE